DVTTKDERTAKEQLTDMTSRIKQLFDSDPNFRSNVLTEWKVLDEDGTEILLPESDVDEAGSFIHPKVPHIVQLIFDGMRTKPYTDANIASAIAMYICLETAKSGWNFMKQAWGHILGIEFSGGFTRGRGFCDPARITDALRPDFAKLVKPDVKLSETELE